MELIRNKRYLNKLLVLMPPRVETDEKPTWSNLRVSWSLSFRHGLQRVENFAGDESYKLTLRWQQLRAALANVEAFRELPKYAPDGLIGLHLARNGQPVLLVGPRIAWEVHYERAIRYAVYGMFCGTNAAAEKTNSN
jgi:hypothetical protein